MKLKELLKDINDLGRKTGCSTMYICGGLPRDKALNRMNLLVDIDITTGDETIGKLAYETLRHFSKIYNIKAKTSSDGHQTIFFKNMKLDFSSNFITPNIENILKKKMSPLEKEMYSRDFNINSLLLSVDFKDIIDVTGKGLPDIRKKIIDTCLEPEITFKSNKNRVVRAVYMASKLDFKIADRVKDYIKSNPDSIKFGENSVLISKLNKSFITNPQLTYKNLTELNLWQHIPISETMQPFYERWEQSRIK